MATIPWSLMFLQLQAMLKEFSPTIESVSINKWKLVLAVKWIKIEVESTPSKVKLIISDSGLGIPLEIHTKIMQPFFTTKEIGKGLGLGLSISKGIVEAHGGNLFLETGLPHAIFIVELPKVCA